MEIIADPVVHGRISRFCEVGRDGDLFLYRAEVVPWLWFLSLSRECRIYQHLNVPEIVEQVFTGLGYNVTDSQRDEQMDPRHPVRDLKVAFFYERHDGDGPLPAGLLVSVRDGSVTSRTTRLEGEPDAWASGSVTEWLLWALHVVTASYDRPGGMWFNPGFLHSFDRAHLVATPSGPGSYSRS